MSEPYISQIILLPYDWAPVHYSKCDGTLLDPNQNPALYSLIQNIYGGSGVTSFALPDLRGRAVMHQDQSTPFLIGYKAGVENVALDNSTMPRHTHSVIATDEPGNKYIATDCLLAKAEKADDTPFNLYSLPTSSVSDIVTMNTSTCSNAGSGTPHTNMQPSIVMNYCIAVSGTYPPRN